MCASSPRSRPFSSLTRNTVTRSSLCRVESHPNRLHPATRHSRLLWPQSLHQLPHFTDPKIYALPVHCTHNWDRSCFIRRTTRLICEILRNMCSHPCPQRQSPVPNEWSVPLFIPEEHSQKPAPIKFEALVCVIVTAASLDMSRLRCSPHFSSDDLFRAPALLLSLRLSQIVARLRTAKWEDLALHSRRRSACEVVDTSMVFPTASPPCDDWALLYGHF